MESKLTQPNIYDSWHNIPEETVQDWMKEENLSTREKRMFEGFEITSSIDGGVDKNIEISLVQISSSGVYPQHIHEGSDAYFIIVDGKAVLLTGKEKRAIEKGERVDIPRGTPHGFELEEGDSLKFISIQSPPIRDEHTHEEDFKLWEEV